MATLLSDLLKAALRRAGITTLPGITPSTTQFTELIPETNRMMGSLNLDGSNIYSTSIDRYALTPQQTTYFIGPTGDFQAPRPIYIFRANIVVTSASPEIHYSIRLLTDEQWAAHAITEIPAAWPWEMYNDGASPDSKLHLFGYPTAANDLELFTWQALKSDFSAVSDAADFPPGYEDALVTNLALRCVALYPLDMKLSLAQLAKLEKDAARARDAVQIMNTQCKPLYPDAALTGRTGRSAITDRVNIYGPPWGSA